MALGRQVGSGTAVLGALGRQVGLVLVARQAGWAGKAGQPGRGRLILAQGRPPRAALDAKLALERRFWELLDVKLALILVRRLAVRQGRRGRGAEKAVVSFLTP